MFRNEYKPPLTLWIERNHYNTDNREEENLTNLFTLNEEEDPLGFYYPDEVSQKNSNSAFGHNNYPNSNEYKFKDKRFERPPSSNKYK